MTSRTIKPGRCRATESRAWSPRLHTATSNPSLFRTSSSPSRMCGSSSTIKIFVFIYFAFIRGGNRSGWQSQSKAAPAAVIGFAGDVATVRPGDLARQRQSQSGPLDSAAERIVRAIELLEDSFLGTGRHAQAAVEYAHLHVPHGLRLLPDFHAHFLAIGRIFLRVGKQVDDDLGERVA